MLLNRHNLRVFETQAESEPSHQPLAPTETSAQYFWEKPTEVQDLGELRKVIASQEQQISELIATTARLTRMLDDILHPDSTSH